MKLITLSLIQNVYILSRDYEPNNIVKNLLGAVSGFGGFKLSTSLFLILFYSKKLSDPCNVANLPPHWSFPASTCSLTSLESF
jgi:hypothetical protein